MSLARGWRRWILAGIVALAITFGVGLWFVEPYNPTYDAAYVGSDTCGTCHTGIHERWTASSHARMTRRPSETAVVGNFDGGSWTLPTASQQRPEDGAPVARMFKRNHKYYMALRHPHEDRYVPFEIAWVVGFQYRQVYLTEEEGGVLRRLPLQWSVPRGEFFPYWNFQEESIPTVRDLWLQMGSLNSAWNLYCARCHTTHLEVRAKDQRHTRAVVDWLEPGIACEACHGPGSLHVGYFKTNYANRVAGFFQAKVRGRHAPYIASATKLDKGRASSVCARCHGTDILMSNTDIYRMYEPGFSRVGKTNDLSPYFYQTPLSPGRADPTIEVYLDGMPKGIGMLFRSFIESSCFKVSDVRCQDCHDPHDNRKPSIPGRLEPSSESNAYCLGCHQTMVGQEEDHSGHRSGTPGSFCYDCHLPRTIEKITAGLRDRTRTHLMSSVPRPEDTVRFGIHGAPNACNECHIDRTAQWAADALNPPNGARPE
ncbi:MAG: multiheme c-type cytochrome [Myxococcota bacterium]